MWLSTLTFDQEVHSLTAKNKSVKIEALFIYFNIIKGYHCFTYDGYDCKCCKIWRKIYKLTKFCMSIMKNTTIQEKILILLSVDEQ